MAMWHLLAFGLSLATAGTTPVPPFADHAQQDNAEMAALFEADQAARSSLKPEQLKDKALLARMIADDQQRRAKVRQLLDQGLLNTAQDYYGAAFVYQHGLAAEDYLLAHSLALAAMAKGKSEASWIASATLDRYLQKIGQKQIYGTQYTSAKETGPTMEPYDTALIPDSLRTLLGVPDLQKQQARLSTMRAAGPLSR